MKERYFCPRKMSVVCILGRMFDKEVEVQQIDVTPTLSSLLGVPIPQNSLGVTIPETAETLPVSTQLGLLHGQRAAAQPGLQGKTCPTTNTVRAVLVMQ